MTREEQIEKAEIEYFNKTSFDGCDYVGEVAKTAAFIAGAKWADEHPKEGLVSIDKVCKWLGNRDVMEKILHCRTSLIDDYVKAFRKAMEE